MCRYAAKPYKDHYACFTCRKVFRVTPLNHREIKVALDVLTGKPVITCPDCKKPMINMGLDFKAPEKSDIKQWRKVEVLAAADIKYHSCGCGGPGYRPKNLSEVPAFLSELKKEEDKSANTKRVEAKKQKRAFKRQQKV